MGIFIGKISSDFLFEIFEISPFLYIIKYWCQSKLAVRTFLSAKGNVNVEMCSVF